jgi:DNA-binding NtrC family response regulator
VIFRFRTSPIIDVVAGSPNKSLPTVMIVEDEPPLRMLAVEVVEEAGSVAFEAGDADEAVALLESRHPCELFCSDLKPIMRSNASAGASLAP